MRREEIIELETPAQKCIVQVERRPLYFEQSRVRGAEGPIFGWYHSTPTALQSDCAAVICGPIGHEYTRSHRTIRHLADRLAEQGVPALRFDYHGIGDSPGEELDPERVAYWQASIRAAIRQARAVSGRERVCLIGVRLGGLLAAVVAAEAPVDLLVLWNVPAKGRAYVRELQALAMAARRGAQDSERGLESAGFTMAPQTLDALRKIDLTQRTPRAGRVLLLGRDDIAPDTALAEHFRAQGVPCETARAPGWLGMMADHQFTVVPDEALDAIAGWVASHVDPRMTAPAPAGAARKRANRFVHAAIDGSSVSVQEEACLFGAGHQLFGILTEASAPSPDRPVVLLANAGAIHHVGPNRLYVTLARELAALGFAAFRFDLENLGDSVRRGEGPENYPYPDTAVDDVRAAIALLQARGYRRFIVAGVCSGAHTAYHAGLHVQDAQIEELVLVNPWHFYWEQGMSLDDTEHFVELAGYKKSMKDPSRWMRVLRGEVNLARAARVAFSHGASMIGTRAKSLGQLVGLVEEPRLSRDLKRVLRTRHMAMYFSDGEPGRDLLMRDARRAALRAQKAGRLELHDVRGADHTFSQWTARQDILQRLLGHFGQRYRVAKAARASEEGARGRRAA